MTRYYCCTHKSGKNIELSLFLPKMLLGKDIIAVRTSSEEQIWFCEVQQKVVIESKETEISVKWFALKWSYENDCVL